MLLVQSDLSNTWVQLLTSALHSVICRSYMFTCRIKGMFQNQTLTEKYERMDKNIVEEMYIKFG